MGRAGAKNAETGKELDEKNKIKNNKKKVVGQWISETKPDINKDKGLELNPIWLDLLRTTKLMNPG